MPEGDEVLIRFAEVSDIPALKALDRWPRERVWRHKVAVQELRSAPGCEV
ncbi:MAG: hypothetical protein KGZ60_00270 [Truepera sp.]|nr:hypothetical protein [Truepera sp.]